MKAVAASNIRDYEHAVAALRGYYETVERGLEACFRDPDLPATYNATSTQPPPPCFIVFGTDQGLVGRFNDTIADFTLTSLTSNPRPSSSAKPQTFSHSKKPFVSIKPKVWVVGERLYERLYETEWPPQTHFEVPNSVKSITPMIGQILLDIESQQPLTAFSEVHLFYNRPGNGSGYSPVTQRLLPLDQHWRAQLAERTWPSNNLPELLGDKTATLGALIREYLFVSLFRASAESLSSENASRLAAMQRADRNIEALLATLQRNHQRLRQANIDAEMFDVIAGATI